MTVAALYIDPRGPYPKLLGPDLCWDEQRDARLYAGPWPVVAHPPCQRWGRYWSGGPMLAKTPKAKLKGDDGGCFAAALAAVRKWGGVLEHPEASHAWSTFGLLPPDKGGGWFTAGDFIGWTCCVEQGHFGHRGRKATWLYAAQVRALPIPPWGKSDAGYRLDDGYHSAEERRRATRTGAVQRMSKFQRMATPVAFAEWLISLAEMAGANRSAA